MMEEREMLTLAAKAVGYKVFFTASGECRTLGPDDDGVDRYIETWHPNSDNAQAFQLSVNLGINIAHDPEGYRAIALSSTTPDEAIEPYGEDACAAARRAILRVAAEIGKQIHDRKSAHTGKRIVKIKR